MGLLRASLITVVLLQGNAQAVECGMDFRYEHVDARGTNIYQAPEGIPSLFYRADMDVNTDGTPRSYHPQDPWGNEGLALNNIANALTGAYDEFLGPSRYCKPRQGECYESYVNTFIAARDAGYRPDAPWVTTYSIIPWRYDEAVKRAVPCTIQSGPYAGYFVSQTAYPYDASLGLCDQGRYIDSMAINTAVLPGETHWESQGVATDGFDLVVAFDGERAAFGINGDRGPSDKIGEVSVRMALDILNIVSRPLRNYQDVKGLALEDVVYLTFPTRDYRRENPGVLTQAQINEWGEAVFGEWGGVPRLQACMELKAYGGR